MAQHGFLAGLLHDAGKSRMEFQQYLRTAHAASAAGLDIPRRGSVAHAPPGAVAAHGLAAHAAAWVIAGHHGGLHSATALAEYLQRWGDDPGLAACLRQIHLELSAGYPDAAGLTAETDALCTAATGLDRPCCQEFLLRMLFSALTDADWLDAESFFAPKKADARDGGWPDLAGMQAHFTQYMAGLVAKADHHSTVNQIRAEVLSACLRAGELPPGVFRLTVPTGGGKTLAALGFALDHALRHSMDRIIVAIPYTSIIDQTAAVYRAVFAACEPSPVVEHHSALDPARMAGNDADDADDEAVEQMRLASENWDAPLIVTTTVQLFDSLFANKPSPCRKLHNLARSVIILDEVQTLPVAMLEPCISILDSLVKLAGASVVLCTATQPALAGRSRFLRSFSPAPVEILDEPTRLFKRMKRVEYSIEREAWSWNRLAAELRRHEQCLVVLNTKRDALAVLDELGGPGELTRLGVLHLSTLLYGAHRRMVIDEVHRRLHDGLPVRLVSTQVVEAGVDLDFPVVFRALGPLDRIVQAAGRCNREGGLALGRVVVFPAAEGGMPQGAYKEAFREAQMLLARERADLHDPGLYTEYFRRLYQDVSTDAKEIQKSRARLNFPETAVRGHLIDAETVPVIISNHAPTAGPVAALLEEARRLSARNRPVSRDILRRLQQYTVALYEHEAAKHAPLIDGTSLPGLQLWRGGYDDLAGIRHDGIQPESLIL